MKKNSFQRIDQVRKTHCFSQNLTVDHLRYRKEVLRYTFDLLKEDLFPDGDITTQFLGIGSEKTEAQIISKSSGILAGIEEVEFFLKFLETSRTQKNPSRMSFRFLKKDGNLIQKGDIIVVLKGNVEDILKVERTLLNLLQRMSGIATLTFHYVEKASFSHAKKSAPLSLIVPTRKTLWGLLDKKACVVGGGGTHRLNLSDAVLLKDTHLKFTGLDKILKKIAQQILHRKVFGRFLEIEVESYEQAMKVGIFFDDFSDQFSAQKIPLILMLDNMKPAAIQKIIAIFQKKGWHQHVFFEASGGITLENIRAYAKSGVDILSVGALTHSAPALDFSLKIVG